MSYLQSRYVMHHHAPMMVILFGNYRLGKSLQASSFIEWLKLGLPGVTGCKMDIGLYL